MGTAQKDKKVYYIAGIGVILGIFLITKNLYGHFFDNGVKEHIAENGKEHNESILGKHALPSDVPQPNGHLDIEKTPDRADYIERIFAFIFSVHMLDAYMTLWVAFGFKSQYFSYSLARSWGKILYGAFAMAAFWLIKWYFVDDKRNMVQWGGQLVYGLLSIGGTRAAACYLQQKNDKNIRAIAGVSLIGFILYYLPKGLNRIATASLALIAMPRFQKIARPIQGFTAFLLQPNVDVVGTVMVMGAVSIYRNIDEINNPNKYLYMICFIPLAFYFFVEAILFCSTPRQIPSTSLIVHGMFCLALSFIEGISEKRDKYKYVVVPIFYIIVVLVIAMLADMVVPKGYRKTPYLSIFSRPVRMLLRSYY